MRLIVIVDVMVVVIAIADVVVVFLVAANYHCLLMLIDGVVGLVVVE